MHRCDNARHCRPSSVPQCTCGALQAHLFLTRSLLFLTRRSGAADIQTLQARIRCRVDISYSYSRSHMWQSLYDIASQTMQKTLHALREFAVGCNKIFLFV